MLAVRPWMQLRKSACIRAPSRDSAQPPFPARPGRVGFDGPPSPQQGCADFPDAWQVLADDVGGFYSAGHRRTDDFIKLQLQACESQVLGFSFGFHLAAACRSRLFPGLPPG
ncbi:uncharacterized protein AAG666_023222 isoform 6-T27 [Megaptera novaeangliae]